MVSFLVGVLCVLIIYLIIAVLWMAAEKVFYGHITHRSIDDVVAIILAVSLYLNLK